MAQEIVVLVTCPPKEAESLASKLLEEELVACINVVPAITSIYRWKDELCKDTESLLLMKTSEKLWNQLENRILELHSYEVPEIICVPIERGNQAYLDWLNANLLKVKGATG